MVDIKILVFIILLLWTSLIYSNDNVDARVFIRANFIKGLEIDLSGGELDFGDILPGETAHIDPSKYDPSKVQMNIKGNKDSKVQIIFPEKLALYNPGGNTVEYRVDIREKFRGNQRVPSGTSFIIPKRNNEAITLFIGGEIDSYTTTKPGTYTGDLNIRVIYNER